jgi:chromosomal replication initiation ATPase DnaA
MKSLTPKTTHGISADKIVERFKRHLVYDLLQAVSAETGVSEIELASASRSARVVKARMSVYRALREKGWSYPDIGALMDKDHSTVYVALNRR